MLKFEPFKRYKDKVQLFTFCKRSIYHTQNKEKISGGNQLPVKTENQVKMYLKTLKKYKNMHYVEGEGDVQQTCRISSFMKRIHLGGTEKKRNSAANSDK
jgi:hypothetical protein